jgi:hypothetical protein
MLLRRDVIWEIILWCYFTLSHDLYDLLFPNSIDFSLHFLTISKSFKALDFRNWVFMFWVITDVLSSSFDFSWLVKRIVPKDYSFNRGFVMYAVNENLDLWFSLRPEFFIKILVNFSFFVYFLLSWCHSVYLLHKLIFSFLRKRMVILAFKMF